MSRRLELVFKRVSKTFLCSIVFVIVCCSAFYAKADTGFYTENDSKIDKDRLFYIDICYDSTYGISSAIININFDGDMAAFRSVKDESDETVIKAKENGGTISIIYADCSEDKNDQRLFTLCLKSLKEGKFDINISCEELVEKNSSDYQISQVKEESLCNVTVNEKSVSVKTTNPARSSKDKNSKKNKASDKEKNSKNLNYDSEFIEDYDEDDGETDKINISSDNNDIVRFTVIIVIVVFIGFVVFYFVIERKLKKFKNKDKDKDEEEKDKDKEKEKSQDDNKEEKEKDKI